jgi:hypothetical protein
MSRVVRWVLIASAALILPLQFGASCDPTVKTAVIDGFNGLADTMVTALFQSVAANAATTGT